VSTVEEGGQEEGVGVAIGGTRICLAVEGDGLVGPYASCDNKVGEEDGVGGAHEVGNDASMGGGGQQICVAEVTCVVWRRVVVLGSCFWHKGVF